MTKPELAPAEPKPFCDGALTKDILAGVTVARMAKMIEDSGYSQRAARSLARRVLRAPKLRGDCTENHWVKVATHIDQTMHRDANGQPSSWGLFWMHVQLSCATAQRFLAHRNLPHLPGSYELTPSGWSKSSDHAWRLALQPAPDNSSDDHLAAELLSATYWVRDCLERRDYAAALHVTFHLAELNYELALRLSGIRALVEIGIACSEKNVSDEVLDPKVRRRDEFWEAYEQQYVGEKRSAALNPTAFAKQHWRVAGFPSAGAAQKFLSRRLSGERG